MGTSDLSSFNAPSDFGKDRFRGGRRGRADGPRATEMESVLSLCEARGLNESMLERHYRSRDPSLIKVSNSEFYDSRLILPPCPTQEDANFGLKLVRVPGIYSSSGRGGGRSRTNRIEAEQIAFRLRELASLRPKLSVGIVAFSKLQADMITEVLEFQRRKGRVRASLSKISQTCRVMKGISS